MSINNRISVNPNIMGGKPCIRGTRITVGNIVDQLSLGRSMGQIITDFPELEAEDIEAALDFFRAVQTEEVEIPIDLFTPKTC